MVLLKIALWPLLDAPVVWIWRPYLHFCLRYWTYMVLLKIALWPWKLGQGHPWHGTSKISTRCTCGINMKVISTFLPEILDIRGFTKNSPVTLKTRSRSSTTRKIKDLYQIHMWCDMKAISTLLPEILDIHGFTKNSPVTLKTRSRSSTTRQIKDLYPIHMWCEYESHICIYAWNIGPTLFY